jgi:hypothetical protein
MSALDGKIYVNLIETFVLNIHTFVLLFTDLGEPLLLCAVIDR